MFFVSGTKIKEKLCVNCFINILLLKCFIFIVMCSFFLYICNLIMVDSSWFDSILCSSGGDGRLGGGWQQVEELQDPLVVDLDSTCGLSGLAVDSSYLR